MVEGFPDFAIGARLDQQRPKVGGFGELVQIVADSGLTQEAKDLGECLMIFDRRLTPPPRSNCIISQQAVTDIRPKGYVSGRLLKAHALLLRQAQRERRGTFLRVGHAFDRIRGGTPVSGGIREVTDWLNGNYGNCSWECLTGRAATAKCP